MAEKTYLQTIYDGIRQEMRRDKRVFVIGEDVGVYGGAFKVTLGFQEEFGAWRVIDAPLSETAIVGGAPAPRSSACAPSPRCSSPTSSPAPGPPLTVAAKQRRRAGTPVPMVVACPPAAAFRWPVPLAEPGGSFATSPVSSRLPGHAGGREGADVASIEDPNPVLLFGHKHLYRASRARCPTSATSRRSAKRGRTARAPTSRSSRRAPWSTRPTRPPSCPTRAPPSR